MDNRETFDTDILLEDLRASIRDRSALIVVGTGISVGATNNAEAASWTGLLKNGIDRCVGLRRADIKWANRNKKALESGELDELLSVAELITGRLGGEESPEFSRWLAESVGALRAQSGYTEVLEALKQLGAPLATTNYDGLLEEVTGLLPVHWQESAEVEKVIRGDADGILHLHGYWNNPSSIVLGTRSYDRVRTDPHAQEVLRTLRMVNTLIFVGYGSGLSDPNFAGFLSWSRAALANSEYRHFRLARNSDAEATQQQHPAQERIFVIPYGENHSDLGPLLRSLVPPTGNEPNPREAMHAIWNVPHDRNPHFTGRATQLQQLTTNLLINNETAVVQHPDSVQTLHGLGGVGKTQLAVEYLYRQRSQYEVVWWIRSEDSTTLAGDYAALATALGLPEAVDSNQSRAVLATKRWLEAGQRKWILVFDNANTREDLKHYLPETGGHVLITSRNREWWQKDPPIEVNFFEQEDAVAYLQQRLVTEPRAASEALATELERLPLALVQAASYILARGWTIERYLERYRTYAAELLDHQQPHDYPSTVVKTWEISFRAASKGHPAAEMIMNLLAFLNPESIPEDMIRNGSHLLPTKLSDIATTDKLWLDDVIVALRRYSLIEVSAADDSISIHRLVQFINRLRLGIDAQREWALAAVQLVNGSFPRDAHQSPTWKTATRLLSHGSDAVSHAESIGAIHADLGQLLNKMGRYLTGRARYRDAQALLERALRIHEETLGVDHPDTAMDINDLAKVLFDQGNYESAEKLHRRALRIRGRALGLNHPDVALSLEHLAGILAKYAGDKNLQQAEIMQRRALAIQQASLGPYHPDFARALGNLAIILRDRDGKANLQEAELLSRRSLEILELALDPDHPDLARGFVYLASVLRASGKPQELQEAESLQRKALGILEAALGPDHPDVATIWQAIADIAIERRNIPTARSSALHSLAIHQSAQLPHSEASDFYWLARVSLLTDNHSGVRKLLMLRWIILDDINSPMAKKACKEARSSYNPKLLHQFSSDAEKMRREYARDRGQRVINQIFR